MEGWLEERGSGGEKIRSGEMKSLREERWRKIKESR